METMSDNFPLKKMLWYPTMKFVSNDYCFKACFFLYHYLPGFLVDIYLKMAGHKLRLFKIYNMIWINFNVLEYFFKRNYSYEDYNMRRLYEQMSKIDHAEFPVMVDILKMRDYVTETLDGARKYLFKMSVEDCRAASVKLKYLKIAHYTFITILYSAIALFTCNFLSGFWSK